MEESKTITSKRGWQKALASTLEIAPRHLSDILHGRRCPSRELAAKLEINTGIDRRAWMWPDEFPNPLMKCTKKKARGSRKPRSS